MTVENGNERSLPSAINPIPVGAKIRLFARFNGETGLSIADFIKRWSKINFVGVYDDQEYRPATFELEEEARKVVQQHLPKSPEPLVTKRAAPPIGSLPYKNFIAEIRHHIPTGQVSVQLTVDLHNSNDFLLKFRGSLRAETNGRSIPAADQERMNRIEGYVPANSNISLIYDVIFDVIPRPNPDGKTPAFDGFLEYDVRAGLGNLHRTLSGVSA